MTEQRDRVITDPGIGPVHPDESTTLRSITAAEDFSAGPETTSDETDPFQTRLVFPVPEESTAEEVEPNGASLYYEPLPLISVSNHKTLEIATVKLADDIDPRRSPTEISIPRTPRTPTYDSGWPQAEVILTTSQRPDSPRRRWRVPALLLAFLGALLLLALARGVARRDVAALVPVKEAPAPLTRDSSQASGALTRTSDAPRASSALSALVTSSAKPASTSEPHVLAPAAPAAATRAVEAVPARAVQAVSARAVQAVSARVQAVPARAVQAAPARAVQAAPARASALHNTSLAQKLTSSSRKASVAPSETAEPSSSHAVKSKRAIY